MSEIPSPENLSCFGTARIIVEQSGGTKNARIYKMKINIEGADIPYEHAYVILKKARDEDRPLNEREFAYFGFNVKYIKRHGQDVTDEILNTPWNQL
jgi:hypothetical protein